MTPRQKLNDWLASRQLVGLFIAGQNGRDLPLETRVQIYELREEGLKPYQIAQRLGLHRTTVYRFMERNGLR